MIRENTPESNFVTLYKEVEYVRDTTRRELERLLARKTDEDISHFGRYCEYIVERYRTASKSLQKGLMEDGLNPSEIVLLQETLARDLSLNSLYVLKKLEAIYSQPLPIGAFFGGASRMTALGAALTFMQEVGNLTYQNEWEGENEFKKRLKTGLKGCDAIRCLMWHLKRLDPKNDFPYGNIIEPFLS